ncbi:MAG: hypothetical protein ACTSWQ_06630 [Candidatus Thorarchaeota archaeon]
MIDKEEFLKGWDHFCKCVNFADSAMDAEAISWMNEFTKNIHEFTNEKSIKLSQEQIIFIFLEHFDLHDVLEEYYMEHLIDQQLVRPID